MPTVASVCFFLIVLKTWGTNRYNTALLTTCLLAPANHSLSWPHLSLWIVLSLSEPAESLSNDIQIVCLSGALDQPLLHSAPSFTDWLLLCQSLSWELSTLTAHLSSRCSGQKPSSYFICLPVLCCALYLDFANSVHLAWLPEWDHISPSEWTPRSKRESQHPLS